MAEREPTESPEDLKPANVGRGFRMAGGQRLALALAAVGMLMAACTTTGEIEGHKVRGTAEAPVQQAAATDLHANAPQWFKDTWRQYRDRAAAYGVLYLDRNNRGAGYVWCLGGGCQRLKGNQYQSTKAIQYHHRARESCETHVRENFPAEKPDCALYAISDKIVWKGEMPWETYHAAPALSEEPARSTAAASASSQRNIVFTWEGFPGVFSGEVKLRQNARSGSMTFAAGDGSATCEGRFWLTTDNMGRWESDCGDGLTASGHFTALGYGKGSHGEGTDSFGRKVQFILGAQQ